MDPSITKDYIKMVVKNEINKVSSPAKNGKPKKRTTNRKKSTVQSDKQKLFAEKQKAVSEYMKTLDKAIPAKERQSLAWKHINEKYANNIANNGSSGDNIQHEQVDDSKSKNLAV